MKVKIEQIQVRDNVRFQTEMIDDLVNNIPKFGLLHPVVVKEIPEGGYELIAGLRRLKACKQLGWEEIPVTVVNPEDELKRLDLQLHENLRRNDLNYIELAEAILNRRKYWESIHGPIGMGRPKLNEITEKSVANCDTFIEETRLITKKDSGTIYRILQLNGLDEDLKEQVREGKLHYRFALNQQTDRDRGVPLEVQRMKSKHKRGGRQMPSLASSQPFCEKFDKAPNLVELIFLSNHVWVEIRQYKEKPVEWDRLDMEYTSNLLIWCQESVEFLNKVLEEVQKSMERLMQDSGEKEKVS